MHNSHVLNVSFDLKHFNLIKVTHLSKRFVLSKIDFRNVSKREVDNFVFLYHLINLFIKLRTCGVQHPNRVIHAKHIQQTWKLRESHQILLSRLLFDVNIKSPILIDFGMKIEINECFFQLQSLNCLCD